MNPIPGKYFNLEDASFVVGDRFSEVFQDDDLSLLNQVVCNLDPRNVKVAHWSSVEFITSERLTIATWVPSVGAVLWHVTPHSPRGRLMADRIPQGCERMDISRFLESVCSTCRDVQ